VFDGVCVLCSALPVHPEARPSFAFRLTTAQSPLGQALFRHYGLDAETSRPTWCWPWPAYAKLDTVAGRASGSGGPWRAFPCFACCRASRRLAL
jgi:predicted DCC family thiol-disulfide oxidoreductase YuxK